jgi:regulator of sigma E protease
MSLITILLVFMFLVFFHELGHFLAAKKLGVNVIRFSIGFSMFGLFKPLLIKHYKGTEYVIFPTLFFGGYVQMKGQDDADPTKLSNDSDSYNMKAPWKRMIILLAGPFANILLAWVLYLLIAMGGAKALSPTIGTISDNSPAAQAGLMINDKIISINGTNITTWNDLSAAIKESRGSLKMIIQRQNQYKQIIVTPKILETKNIFNETVQRRMVGISPTGEVMELELSFSEQLSYASQKTLMSLTLIVQSVQKLITGIIPSDQIGSVVSIGKVISDASDVGIIAVFSIMALISVNLGVLNLLPIPALDGGHLMFVLYEMISGRPPSPAVLTQLTMVGWVLLLSLMSLGLYNDFNRLLG